MPQFYEKMKTRLRTVEEGADTIIWLAVADAALKQESGLFFQGMLAWVVISFLSLLVTLVIIFNVSSFVFKKVKILIIFFVCII